MTRYKWLQVMATSGGSRKESRNKQRLKDRSYPKRRVAEDMAALNHSP